MSVYEKQGYKNRDDYLEQLSDEYCVDIDMVFSIADMLGENEDFDGLINCLEDYCY